MSENKNGNANKMFTTIDTISNFFSKILYNTENISYTKGFHKLKYLNNKL